MFSVRFDESQNLLVIRYSGHVSPAQTRVCTKEVRAALTEVPSGFRLLADLSDVRAMDVACAPHLKSIMEMCNQKRISRVVRVIPDPKQDIGFQIMSYFHYRGEVQIMTCSSIEEAMNLLVEQL